MPSQKIYFIGIGGIGMSGLARYFKAHGYAVSGSDSMASAMTDSLKKDAIKVKIGHKKGNVPRDAAFAIYNRAVPFDNPEIVAAHKIGVPTIPYAQVLGRLTEEYFTIAITGSHGKSTTTSITALELIAGGLDPTILVGTNLKEFGGKNIRVGKSQYLVLEADDFGAAFLDYSPFISVVTNVDREHMDFYKTFSGVKRAFLKFMSRTRDEGALILNHDDAGLRSLKPGISIIAKKKKLRVIWYSTKGAAAKKLKTVMQIPGEHNLSNAMAAYTVGRLLNIPERKLVHSIGTYKGAWRRMEYRGKLKLSNTGVTGLVYDDYAHHPTEIIATLKGFKERFPEQPLITVFQPHQAKRLEALFKEFVSAFTETDILILVPFYKVAGRDDANPKYTSEALARAIAKKYPHQKIYYVADPKNIKKVLSELLTTTSIVVMMGAGDIVQYTDSLLT